MSDAFWAVGSQFKTGDGATPEVFTAVAEVKDIVPPQMERDSYEVTHHGSSDGYREYIPGWRDGTDAEFLLNWLPNNTTQDETTGLLSQFNDDELHNFQIVLPDSIATLAFAGFITAFNPETPLENGADLSITIKISGKVTVS
jgi:predicted secreted protein